MTKCEICKVKNSIVKLDKHHIKSKSKGGTNNKNNIAYLCPTCHRKVHQGLIILEGKVFSTAGTLLVYHYKGEKPVLDGLIDTPDVYLI